MSNEQKDYKIIYKNYKPYGIRDRSGFLFFFRDISKYPNQEERYRQEVEEQYSLADYLLHRLNQYNIIPDIEFEAYEKQPVTIAGKTIELDVGDRIIVVRKK